MGPSSDALAGAQPRETHLTALAATWSPSCLPGLTWALAARKTCSSSSGSSSKAGLGVAGMSAVLQRQSQDLSR